MPKGLGVSIACVAMLSLLSCESKTEEVIIEEEVISVAKAQAVLKEYDQALREINIEKVSNLYHPNVSIAVVPCGRTTTLLSRKNLNQMLDLLSQAKEINIDRKVLDASSNISGDKAIITSRVKDNIKIKIAGKMHDLSSRAEQIVHIKDVNGSYMITSLQSQGICR